MRVEIERAVHTPFERIVHDEIQPVQMFNDVTVHVTVDKPGKRLFDPVRGQGAFEQLEVSRIVDPHVHVRGVSLVTRPRMRDVANETGRIGARDAHASRMSMLGFTLARSISTDLVITHGVIAPRKPPPPAGPQHRRDSTSHSIVSAVSRSLLRSVTCNRTSCASAARIPAEAKSELTPIRSMRKSRVTPCTVAIRSRTISPATRPRSCAPGPA